MKSNILQSVRNILYYKVARKTDFNVLHVRSHMLHDIMTLQLCDIYISQFFSHFIYVICRYIGVSYLFSHKSKKKPFFKYES